MKKTIFILGFLCGFIPVFGQQEKPWHGIERTVRYRPEGQDIVAINGTRRFTRALYGTNSAFRVEAGDLPEFALYMPGMGGNLQFGLLTASGHKWLIHADSIKAIYRAGSMIYEIEDSLLGKGKLYLSVLALSDAEGLVVKIHTDNTREKVKLVWVYGGASGKKFSRDGDVGADPESSFYLKPENCADNRYRLMKGKFTLGYGTGKVLTEEERYEIQTKPENQLKGEMPKEAKRMIGYFPESSSIRLMDAADPGKAFSAKGENPRQNLCVTGQYSITSAPDYFLLYNAETPVTADPSKAFEDAEAARQKLAGRISIQTPDSYLNTLGGVLSIAADAIWEAPTYMHGAIAWRMRLPGWRGAYAADVLGWHDRARMHFEAYAKSQLTVPATSGVIMDTAIHLARHLEKVGTQLFSEGYITRNPNGYTGAHHYDMNLVFIDQLLNHFYYTGDTGFIKKMWPLLKKHLAWEKKNFDADGDGLYDSYAAIWASDALQYSGGGVTHSSAYNYRANKEAAFLAKLIGEDGSAYAAEAEKIHKAITKLLWMPEKGWYAEYKDLLGNKLLHPAAGLWTVYHAIDSKVPDAFKTYQSLRYVDNDIPHIPVRAKGWNEKDLYVLSETNWQPYTWSLNNVALGENMHMALAYWQGNRPEEAFRLWRSTLLETMYLGSGPGNFHQLSFYDAMRGELYRDFADGVGMVARSLTEGLFGILPDALLDTLTIKPGYPLHWEFADFHTPDIGFSFKRTGLTDSYTIRQHFPKKMKLRLVVGALRDEVEKIKVNGRPVHWQYVPMAIGGPLLQLDLPSAASYQVSITWKGEEFGNFAAEKNYTNNGPFSWSAPGVRISDFFDPEKLLEGAAISGDTLTGMMKTGTGHKTLFIQLKKGMFTYWQPVNVYLGEPSAVSPAQPEPGAEYETMDIRSVFNDKVTSIFKNNYLLPRPVSPTLQLPVTGIGNWAYHSLKVDIDDSGLRKHAGENNRIITSTGIPFETSGGGDTKNIVFTSMWDNYPDSVSIALNGNASQAWFLMAGSTNPMQSRLVNGEIIVYYTDGSFDKLELKNPENWWPIEQDYYTDGFAFTTGAARPLRISLKTGKEIEEGYRYGSIKGFSNFAIEGGAATVLGLSLDKSKPLKTLVLKTMANDVVTGLMAVTLKK